MHSDQDIKLVEEFYNNRSLQPDPIQVKVENNKLIVVCDKAIIHKDLQIPDVPVDEFTGHLVVEDNYIDNLAPYNLPRIIGKTLTIRTQIMGSFKGGPEQVQSIYLTRNQKTSETHRGPVVAEYNYPKLNSLTGLPKVIQDELLIQSSSTQLFGIDTLYSIKCPNVNIRVPNLLNKLHEQELQLFLKMTQHVE